MYTAASLWINKLLCPDTENKTVMLIVIILKQFKKTQVKDRRYRWSCNKM
jgi:hypothetical protein